MFYLADLTNGVFASFQTEREAEIAYREAIASGVCAELDMQYETGLSDSEIAEKVRQFYVILDETTIQLYQ